MKKYSILIALLVLTVSLMTGCRRPGSQPTELPPTQAPTLMPTTAPTTMPTTIPTTEAPTEAAGDATGSEETENGSATDVTTGERSQMAGSK